MCGIVGVIGTPFASQEVYQGLLLLQHRGQDSAGILSYDFTTYSFHQHKDLGQVGNVFNVETLERLNGQMALGHTRYSTIGKTTHKDIQPAVVGYPFGLGVVHNGNIVNYQEIRRNLQDNYARHLFSNNDVEGILNILAQGMSKNNADRVSFSDMLSSVTRLFNEARGGFSVLSVLADHGLLAFRDPHGIRPLIMGERELTAKEKEKSVGATKSYIFASESNVLDFLGYKIVRDLKPGEVVFIDRTGKIESAMLNSQQHKPCMFEWVYFSTPESTLENRNVYDVRLKMGARLGDIIRPMIANNIISPDMIVPVPETSRVSAISLSEALEIPYREVLIKNRYIQRSFILNSQESRKRAVQLKLTPVVAQIKGKKVLLVDDSIVRGTTSRRIVEMVREAGAAEVYMASTCPPIVHPCFYGIDFPNPEELVAYNRSVDEVAKEIGVDKLIYLDIERLAQSINLPSMCMACLDGKYPVSIDGAEEFRKKRVT